MKSLAIPSTDRVAQALKQPEITHTWTGAEWSTLVRQARAAGLLARVSQRLARASSVGASTPWPGEVNKHVDSAQRVGRAQHREVWRELRHLHQALEGLQAPVILLKGAAYVAAGLPAASGRVFADIDLMVPKSALAAAESKLMLAGWMTTHHNAYDQRYYREWMHELPPMEHLQRGTTIDLHHSILPETARIKLDASRLVNAAVPLQGEASGFHVLSPADMVLHAMTHLFQNDDTTHALRDLSDLDLLMRHFADGTQSFWGTLLHRAEELSLQRLLSYGVTYAHAVLGTPVPPQLLAEVQQHQPPWPVRPLMQSIWTRALRSPDVTGADRPLRLAQGALYLRGHWLRMPPLLLARHLLVKAMRLHEKTSGDASAR